MTNREVDAPAASVRHTAWILGGIGAGLSVVIALWWLREPETFLAQRLGFGTEPFAVPWAWLFVAAIVIGYSWYTVWAVPMISRHKWQVGWFKLIGVWAGVTAGVIEEVVFRQRLMDWLMDRGIGAVGQIAISALVFGLAHALWVLMRPELSFVVPVVGSTVVLGALLAVLYIVADRNVLPCIVAHAGVNLVIEPWLILAAVSGASTTGRA